MSDNNKTSEGDLSNFDPKAFKDEILAANREILNQAMDQVAQGVNVKVEQAILNHANSLKNSEKPIDTISKDVLADFAEEIEAIGVDEKQGSAMLKMMTKLLDRASDKFETKILNKVDSNLTTKETIAKFTNDTLRMFPEIQNKNSDLFKQAKIEFSNMSPYAQKSPEAESIAIERAALRLGIQPRTLKDVKAWDAQHPTSGDPEPKKSPTIDPDTASFFNVDSKLVNEKLKQIKSKMLS